MDVERYHTDLLMRTRLKVNSDPGTQRLRKRRAQAPPPFSHTAEKRVQGSEAPPENRMDAHHARAEEPGREGGPEIIDDTFKELVPSSAAPPDETGQVETSAEIPFEESVPVPAAPRDEVGQEETGSGIAVMESVPVPAAPHDEVGQEETGSGIAVMDEAARKAGIGVDKVQEARCEGPLGDAVTEKAAVEVDDKEEERCEFSLVEPAPGKPAVVDDPGLEESAPDKAADDKGLKELCQANPKEPPPREPSSVDDGELKKIFEVGLQEPPPKKSASVCDGGHKETFEVGLQEPPPKKSASVCDGGHKETFEVGLKEPPPGKAASVCDGGHKETFEVGLKEPPPGKAASVYDGGLKETFEVGLKEPPSRKDVSVYDGGHKETLEVELKNEVPDAYNIGEVDEGAACLEYENDIHQIPKEMKYEHLLAVNDQKIVLYPNEFECPICFCWFKENEGIILKECLHVFCRVCLTNAVKRSVDIDISCPYQDENYNCESFVLETEIEGLLSKKDYEDRLNKALEHAEASMFSSFHCKKPGCNGWCENDGEMLVFSCPVCLSSNCTACNAIHEEMTCNEYIDMVSMKSQWGQRPQAAPSNQVPGRLITAEDYEGGASSFILNDDIDQVPGEMKYEHFLALQEQKIVLYPNEIECPICFDLCKENEGVILKQCLHVFCKDCLINTVKITGDADVKCPYRDENYSCESFMLETEIRGLLSKKEYDERLKRTLEQAEAKISFTFHCLKTDCSGWCINDNKETTQFDCPVCHTSNCLSCKAIHEQMTCNEYLDMIAMRNGSAQIQRSETVLNNMVAQGTAMNCPQCSAVVQKEMGCDSLICSICKTQLCWATKGFRWGPRGTGDISGGCQCGVNGRRCHPNCGNCH